MALGLQCIPHATKVPCGVFDPYIYMGALGEGSGWYIYLRVRPAAPAGIWKSGNLRTWKCENPPIYTLLVGVWGLTLLRMAHIAISSGRSTLELKTEND